MVTTGRGQSWKQLLTWHRGAAPCCPLTARGTLEAPTTPTLAPTPRRHRHNHWRAAAPTPQTHNPHVHYRSHYREGLRSHPGSGLAEHFLCGGMSYAVRAGGCNISWLLGQRTGAAQQACGPRVAVGHSRIGGGGGQRRGRRLHPSAMTARWSNQPP